VAGLLHRLRERARGIKRQSYALYLAARDPRVPWYAKAVVALVAAYAFSPIDLIPDFIPVLGYLDDVILLPMGIALAIRLIPDEIWLDCQARASEAHDRPRSRVAAAVIVLLWIGALFLSARLLLPYVRSPRHARPNGAR
jgi:uncharacterized membrane protein YkvA (DUF1232 family)